MNSVAACYPCSGAGWYVSSSYLSGSGPEVPSLAGPFATGVEASDYAKDLITSGSVDDEGRDHVNTIKIVKHDNSVVEDMWHFFIKIQSSDCWNDENAEIFVSLADHIDANLIVSLLSESICIRNQMSTAFEVVNTSGSWDSSVEETTRNCWQGYSAIISRASDLMELIVEDHHST